MESLGNARNKTFPQNPLRNCKNFCLDKIQEWMTCTGINERTEFFSCFIYVTSRPRFHNMLRFQLWKNSESLVVGFILFFLRMTHAFSRNSGLWPENSNTCTNKKFSQSSSLWEATIDRTWKKEGFFYEEENILTKVEEGAKIPKGIFSGKILTRERKKKSVMDKET